MLRVGDGHSSSAIRVFEQSMIFRCRDIFPSGLSQTPDEAAAVYVECYTHEFQG